MPPLRSKLPVTPLHELHIGTILSPITLGLVTCAPSVAGPVHPRTEHSAGHDTPPELLTQCCRHVPHLQDFVPVPPLFVHPVAGKVLIYVALSVEYRPVSSWTGDGDDLR